MDDHSFRLGDLCRYVARGTMAELPHCDELYDRFFLPWYSDTELANRESKYTRPDVLTCEGLAGRPAAELSRFEKPAQARIIEQISVTMHDAATGDFSTRLGHKLGNGLDGTDEIDRHFDADRVASLISDSDDTSDENDYVITCIELGALLGNNLIALDSTLEWLAEMPYWESSIWHAPTGTMIAPVHWAMKKMSGYGWDDGLVGKCQAAIHIINQPQNAT